MTNPNETLFNGQVRRRIAIERYSDAQARKTLKFLEELRADIVAKIEKAGDPRSYSIRQQRELLRSVNRLHQDVYAKVHNVLDSDFKRMAAEQAKFEAGELRKVATNITVRELSATQAFEVAKARPMQGRFLEDWLSELSPAHRRRLEQSLRLSFIEGETRSQAMQRIREAVNMSGNGLKALIRTSNSHISSAVTLASYQENPDLVEEYEWRSTLDSRTTPICQMRDGQRFKVGEGPIPPAHVSCRSTTTPILKDFPPPKRVTYNEWLKGQSTDVQDEILGKRRGAAYRAGASVKDFTSSTGRPKRMTTAEFKKGMDETAAGQKRFRRNARKYRVGS